MNTIVMPRSTPTTVRKGGERSLFAGDVAVLLAVSLLVWLAWEISHRGYFTAGDDVGYWIGVMGGVLMLLLFSYPLRKHLRFTHRWGKMKFWLWLHVFLGVMGPMLILVHSTFRVGSLNAGVALYSMIVVALSGVVGRFIYARVNRGLHGEKTNLRELTSLAGLHQSDANSKLSFAPAVVTRLKAFSDGETSPRPNFGACLRRVFWLPLVNRITYHACLTELRKPLQELALLSGWDGNSVSKRERLAHKLVKRHLDSVVRVAQYTAYERLFSLWHVAHIPFVYLLVVSAIVHVFAVHIY